MRHIIRVDARENGTGRVKYNNTTRVGLSSLNIAQHTGNRYGNHFGQRHVRQARGIEARVHGTGRGPCLRFNLM